MRKLAFALALLAHGFAWVAFLFLLFWPTYSGSSVSPVAVNMPGELPSRAPLTRVEPGVTRETFSATLVDVNGVRIIPILAIPVALTAVAVLASLKLHRRRMLSMVLLWSSTIVLVLFSLLGLLSIIGLFYFPAALAMIAAAVLGSIVQAGGRAPDTATEA